MRGSLRELGERYGKARPLGEITLVVAGRDGREPDASSSDDEVLRSARRLLDEGSSLRDAASVLAEITGRPRREVYRLLVDDDGRPLGDGDGDGDRSGDGTHADPPDDDEGPARSDRRHRKDQP